MASIYDIKPKFQTLLRPIVGKLAAAGITANQVTVSAIILSFLGGGFIAFFPDHKWPLFLVPAVLFIRMALNAIDGMLAREFNMKTSLGAILNELGDVISDTALYLPLAMIPGIKAFIVVLLIILSIISEMTGVISVQIGGTRRYDGPMGKSDRAFWIGLCALLMGTGVSASPWINTALLIVGILTAVTTVNRARKSLEELK
jgi:CDP-diacylglycerol--glycerol-3-phosphate 3-phosphatidyltransferase